MSQQTQQPHDGVTDTSTAPTAPTRLRAKFRVSSRKLVYGADGQMEAEEVALYAVYSDDPNSEDKAFFAATPTASVSMTINNPRGWGFFARGQTFYADFIPVEPLVST